MILHEGEVVAERFETHSDIKIKAVSIQTLSNHHVLPLLSDSKVWVYADIRLSTT